MGDKINVWVLSVDNQKHRIALTMLDPATRDARKAEHEKQKQERADKKAEWQKIKAEREQKHEEWLKRQAEREKRKAEGGADRARGFDNRGNGSRRDFRPRDGEKGEFGKGGERRPFGDRERRSGYRDKTDERKPSTENMSMEEKLAALADMFNKK